MVGDSFLIRLPVAILLVTIIFSAIFVGVSIKKVKYDSYNEQTLFVSNNSVLQGNNVPPSFQTMVSANGIYHDPLTNQTIILYGPKGGLSNHVGLINSTTGKIMEPGSLVALAQNYSFLRWNQYSFTYSDSSHVLYVADNSSILEINSDFQVVRKVTTSFVVIDISYDPFNNEFYFIGGYSGSVGDWIIITNSTFVPIYQHHGFIYEGLLYNPVNHDVYFTNFYSKNVEVATPDNVVKNITVGPFPLYLAVNSNNGDVYVSSSSSPLLTVISSTLTTVNISTQKYGNPNSVVFDSENGLVSVDFNNKMVLYDGTKQVENAVPIGTNPISTIYDQLNNKIYVGNWQSGTVSIIEVEIHSKYQFEESSKLFVIEVILIIATVVSYTLKWESKRVRYHS